MSLNIGIYEVHASMVDFCWTQFIHVISLMRFQIKLVRNTNNDVCSQTMIGLSIYGVQLSHGALVYLVRIVYVTCRIT